MTTVKVVSQLELLEDNAQQKLEIFKKAYWDFVEAIGAIRDSGVWEQTGHITWESYIKARWLPLLPFNSTSRIRQLEAAYPVMNFVRDVTGVTLNESQVRTLRQIVSTDDSHLLPEIVSLVFAYTSVPGERHFKAVYEVLKERDLTNTVTVGDETIRLNATELAAKEAMLESDKRMKSHIADSGKWKTVQRHEIDGNSPIHVTGLEINPFLQRVIVIVQEIRLEEIDNEPDDN